MLSLLLGLEVQTGQSAQVLLAHRLVHRGSATDSLTVVVSRVSPPVGLGLHVAQDHVLDGGGQTRHLWKKQRSACFHKPFNCTDHRTSQAETCTLALICHHCADLPGDVGFPAPPGLAEVLQDGPGLVLLDALGHHVQDVVHHGGTQLQIEVRLHALLGHRLGDSLGMTTCLWIIESSYHT